mmetsp:Transcript_18427/g.20833  ORF Transcript_18427/g.20833 Transcript_18427/m.20833 type:complete len:124 (+) Transcript_18427:174-545(+)
MLLVGVTLLDSILFFDNGGSRIERTQCIPVVGWGRGRAFLSIVLLWDVCGSTDLIFVDYGIASLFSDVCCSTDRFMEYGIASLLWMFVSVSYHTYLLRYSISLWMFVSVPTVVTSDHGIASLF